MVFYWQKFCIKKKKKKTIATPKKEKLDGANDSKKFLEKMGLKLSHYEEKDSELAIFRQQLPTFRQKI
jgi:hypothetical protein